MYLIDPQSSDMFVSSSKTYNIILSKHNSSLQKLHFILDIPNIELNINVVNIVPSGNEHNLEIEVEHKAPDCKSYQTYRSISAGKALFKSSVTIPETGENSDSVQDLKSILIGAGTSLALPALFISNENVSCNHGSTTGKIDDTQLFYLQQRGYTKREAKRILLESFVSHINHTKVDAMLEELLNEMEISKSN